MTESLYIDDTIDFRILTQDKLEDALRIQAISMQEESIANGVGIFEEPGAPEEMQLIFKEIVKDGISVIAVNVQSNDVIAVGFNKLHIPLKNGEKDPFAVFVENNMKHPSCLELIRFLGYIESEVDIFKKYNVDAVMEIFYVGIDPKYRKRGLGHRMIEVCIQVARMLGTGELRRIQMSDEKIRYEEVIPKGIYAIFTSNYTQRIGEKLNFHSIAEFRYENFVMKGKKMSERIGNIHNSAKSAFLRL